MNSNITFICSDIIQVSKDSIELSTSLNSSFFLGQTVEVSRRFISCLVGVVLLGRLSCRSAVVHRGLSIYVARSEVCCVDRSASISASLCIAVATVSVDESN